MKKKTLKYCLSNTELCSKILFLSQDKIRELQEHLHIDNFRKNKAVNMESNYGKRSRGQFVRKARNESSPNFCGKSKCFFSGLCRRLEGLLLGRSH